MVAEPARRRVPGRRVLPFLLLACGIVGLATLLLRQPTDPSPSDLQRTASAYQQLVAAQQQAGLLPFPRNRAEVAALLRGISLDGAAWQESSSSGGATVWQLGHAVELLCDADGGLQRIIYRPTGSSGLTPPALAAALQELAGLGPEQQQPHELTATAKAELQQSAPFFEFSLDGYRWRFTPRFEDGQCSRLDVEELSLAQGIEAR